MARQTSHAPHRQRMRCGRERGRRRVSVPCRAGGALCQIESVHFARVSRDVSAARRGSDGAATRASRGRARARRGRERGDRATGAHPHAGPRRTVRGVPQAAGSRVQLGPGVCAWRGVPGNAKVWRRVNEENYNLNFDPDRGPRSAATGRGPRPVGSPWTRLEGAGTDVSAVRKNKYELRSIIINTIY